MKFSVLTLLLFFGTLVGAQAPGSDEIVEAESLMEKGKELAFEDKDAAYSHLETGYRLFKRQKAWMQCIMAAQEICEVSRIHHDLHKYSESLQLVDSIINSRSTFLDTIEDIRTIKNLHLTNKANYFKLISDFSKSLEYSQQVIFNVKTVPDSLWTVEDIKDIYVAYEFKAGIFTEQKKYDLARDLYDECLRLGTDRELGEKFMAPTLKLLGGLLNRQKKYHESNAYFIQYLSFVLENKTGPNNRALTSYFVIAQNYIRLHQIDSAAHYLSVAKLQLSKNDPLLHRYYYIIGELHRSTGDYKEALMDMDTTIALLSAKNITENNLELARMYKQKAIVYNDQDEYVPALKQLQSAIQHISQGFLASTESWPNPELKEVLNKEELVKILKYKTFALNKLNEYATALETVDLAVNALDELKPTFKSEADKLFLIDDAFPLFESGMAAAYALYTKSKNEKYIDQAFHYSEKSKAVLLLDALLSAQATEFANVPEQLLEKEKQLKSEIAHIERQVNTGKGISTESEDELFARKNEYRNLINTIETKYPSYYDLKYGTDMVSAEQLQQSLATDELLLSYFYGNDAIYAIAIDKNGRQMKRIAIDPSLKKQITKIHGLLTDPKSEVGALGKATHNLYSNLVAPFLKSKDEKKLIVIADGLLNYIPFSCMNTSKNGIGYLVEDYAISYANSATLLGQLRKRHPKDDSVLAFAPNFDDPSSQVNGNGIKLLPLPNNKKEVEEIMNSFSGTALYDENASLNNFKSQVSNFGILHLATHAVFDDRAPEYSYLAFSPKKDEAYLLYVRDLYNLELKADLVTLSACESGIGELRHGEGFLSLARGFFYSGASSISSTLWKITDASSTKLMDGFYKNLSKGDTKDLALQRSQIDFLNANRQNALAHPYYWSGFVISGNTDPVSASLDWWWIAWGGFSLLVVGFMLYGKRKNR